MDLFADLLILAGVGVGVGGAVLYTFLADRMVSHR